MIYDHTYLFVEMHILWWFIIIIFVILVLTTLYKITIKEDNDLKDLNTIEISSTASNFVNVDSINELREAVQFTKTNALEILNKRYEIGLIDMKEYQEMKNYIEG